MAITLLNNSNYQVYINLRSKVNPTLRVQKRVRGIKTKWEAQKTERYLISELSKDLAQKEGLGFSWRMVINYWRRHIEETRSKTYSESTIRDYINMLFRWTGDWLDLPASTITKSQGRAALLQVIELGRSTAFQKRLKSTINMIYNFGIDEGLIRGVGRSPVYGFKVRVIQQTKPEILTEGEIKKLLSEAKNQKHEWYEVWAMAILTGMRNGELYGLRWSDVDFKNNLIKVERSYHFKTKRMKETKAGYWRSVPINKDLRSVLIEMRSDTEFVLPRINIWAEGKQAKVLKYFCRSIGITPIKFHTLRACFATQLIGKGVEPVKVMKICGWRDLKTLGVYLRLAGIDEKGATDDLHWL